MRLLKKQVDDFLIYENVELSILVAIRMEDQKKIKKYWKSKDKSAVEATISGFPVVVLILMKLNYYKNQIKTPKAILSKIFLKLIIVKE